MKISNIPGSYIGAYIEEDVLMVIRSFLVGIITLIDLSMYLKYIVVVNNRPNI